MLTAFFVCLKLEGSEAVSDDKVPRVSRVAQREELTGTRESAGVKIVFWFSEEKKRKKERKIMCVLFRVNTEL